MALGCTYIDDVPVLFGGEGSREVVLADGPGPMGEAVIAALGADRCRWDAYEGEFPLTGELLDRSLALHDEARAATPDLPWLGHHLGQAD